MVVLIMALLEHPERVTQVTECLVVQGHHELCVVSTFERAKATLKNHVFDLIISDVHLENGGSVFDFLRWSKSHPRLHTVPFVLLSVAPSEPAKYLTDGVRTAARALGAAKYITMDVFSADVLIAELSELLSNESVGEAALDHDDGNGRTPSVPAADAYTNQCSLFVKAADVNSSSNANP